MNNLDLVSNPVVAMTGITGFTGGALAQRLNEEGYSFRGLARDASTVPAELERNAVIGELEDGGALKELVAGADAVVHIAAMFRKEGDLTEFERVNVDATRALIEAAQDAGVRRFVYCSTIGVHGDVQEAPADEQAPFNPRDDYQRTKLAAEEVCREAMHGSDMEVVIVRPCSIYGPGDTRMLKMFKMLAKKRFFFVGRGMPNFHPVFIDDLVQGFLLALRKREAANETFIFGGPRYLPLRDYVATAARTIGVKPPSIHLPYAMMNKAAELCETVCKPIGVSPPLHRRRLSFFKHNRAFSINKAKLLLGYRPKVDLEEGFRRTVKWYRDQGLLASQAGAVMSIGPALGV